MIGGGGVAVLHRRERPHEPPAPAAAPQAGQHVVARLAALAGDDPDRARQRRSAAASSGARTGLPPPAAAAGRSSWASRSPSPAIRSPVTSKEKRGEAVRAAGVVVAAAGDDDLRPRRRARPRAARARRAGCARSSTAPRRRRRAARSRPCTRERFRFTTSPKICTRGRSRRNSWKPFAQTPTGKGPGSALPSMPSGRWAAASLIARTPCAGPSARRVASFTDASGVSPGSARWPRCSPSRPSDWSRAISCSPSRRAG